MALLASQVRKRRRLHPQRRVPSADVQAPTQIEPNLIKRIIDAQDNIPERGRVAVEYVHLSSLINVCPRAQVIARDTNTEITNTVTGGHRVMWKIGRIVEAHIRDSYINAVNFEGVYGAWECACRRTSYTGFFKRSADRCRWCDYIPSNYAELTVFDDDAGIAGNPDMVLEMGRRKVITEIKSMNKDQFDELQAPLPDHVTQAGGYRRLYELNGHRMADQVVIFYCTKAFKWGSPYKEMHVDVGHNQTLNNSLDIMWRTARDIKDGSLQALPPRVCNSVGCTQSKNCPVMTICWSL